VNKQDLPVRYLVVGGPAKAKADRRIRRTTDALVTALIELAHARRYDAITIQDLLDHANVGRSTFYSHYRGKDDLLLRSFERMLASLDAGIDQDKGNVVRIAPVRELFTHFAQMRGFLHSLERAHRLDRVLQVGAVQLSATIARRLAALAATPDGVPPAARAQALAGALFALLRWWLDQEKPESPERMDAMYHAICLGTPGSVR
jgi:AcrR family transcriptional regulator